MSALAMEIIMAMREPVAVFFTDLNLSVDEWQSDTTWTELTSVGPHMVVHWDRTVPVPEKAQRAALA